jgi:superfamily II DNA or RNA helicase
MKPYPYQKKDIDEIFLAFETEKRVLYQLATGGGKTAMFSFISKQFIKNTGKRVLVLAHRDKLIKQTLKTMRTIGVTSESVVASKKDLQHTSNAYIAMIQTIKNRLRDNPLFVKDIGLIVIDEAHLDMHKDIFEYFPGALILAVTATPISLKKVSFSKCGICSTIYDDVRMCCKFETYEYTRKFHYSETYGHIVIGKSISELIMDGELVRDLNYEVGSVDRSKFAVDAKTGDFDKKSTEEYFGEFNVVKNYEQICFGEKTIIFNSSTSTNLKCYNDFIDAGYENIRMIDSVNTKKSEVDPILEWYRVTPDAILLNCDVLTAGFDEPTIQAVILNRSTLSLSLFLQMIGRGGRKCLDVYKPYFKVIDGGGNIKYFADKYGNSGKWSDEYDWSSIFYGTDEKAKPKKEPLDQVKECPECGGLLMRVASECMYCGHVIKPPLERIKISSEEVAVLVDEIPLPNGKKIVEYVTRVGREKSFAWAILQNQVMELFIRHGVALGTYSRTQDNGKFEISMRNIIKEPYASIQGSELQGTQLRTKAYIIGKIKSKLDKHYNL